MTILSTIALVIVTVVASLIMSLGGFLALTGLGTSLPPKVQIVFVVVDVLSMAWIIALTIASSIPR